MQQPFSNSSNETNSGFNASQRSGEPPVDFDLLNSIFDNDPDQVREVLVLYLEQAAEQIKGMGAAIQSNSGPDLNHLAHKCAGSSASCGMGPIVPPLRELEQMGKEGRASEAQLVYARVQNEFKAIQEHLASHLGH